MSSADMTMVFVKCEFIHSHSVIHQSPAFVGLWSCLSQYFNSLILGSYHIRNNQSKISNKFLDLSLQLNVCMHILTSKGSKLWCGYIGIPEEQVGENRLPSNVLLFLVIFYLYFYRFG